MRVLKYLLLVVLLLVIAGGVAAYFGAGRMYESYKGYTAPEVFVDIPQGAGPITIADRLVDAGVVRDEMTFRAALWVSGRARDLKAGEYRFAQPMTPLQVIDRIARGDVHRRAITFREGLTIPEMARVFEQNGFGSAEDFIKAASDPTPIRDLDPQAPDLEGYLFPETYALPRDTPAATLVAQMVNFFEKAFSTDLREAVKARGLTVREAVTLASL